MEYLMTLIGLSSLLIAIIMNYDKINGTILTVLSRQDLIFERIDVTFDIISRNKINVYKTGKFIIKKNNPQIIIGNYSEFGDIIDAKISIDNITLNRNDYIEEHDLNLIKHNLFHKKIGDSSLINFSYTYTLNDNQIKTNEDGLGELIKYHRCKKLVLHLIFPKNFNPLDLKITKSTSFSKKDKDIVLDRERILISNVMEDRKQIIWSKDFPKIDNSYSIKWCWDKTKC